MPSPIGETNWKDSLIPIWSPRGESIPYRVSPIPTDCEAAKNTRTPVGKTRDDPTLMRKARDDSFFSGDTRDYPVPIEDTRNALHPDPEAACQAGT
uniref:Uncharacterized protein n=1 Tax=Caenorhabditis japonica TaxID=281687 RepID=A0A8R1EA19_CAEJA